MKVDLAKKYQTRNGHPVRILCIDAKGEQPVVGLYLTNTGTGKEAEVPTNWFLDGRWSCNDQGSDLDLVEVPKKIERTFWANIYPDNPMPALHISKDQADRLASEGRIACVQVKILAEEGAGLCKCDTASHGGWTCPQCQGNLS